MGRVKTYDPEDVRRRAMELFWEKGYHDTSTSDLTRHIGINKYSLYAEFDSKEEVFKSAIQLYSDEVLAANYGSLESTRGGVSEIVSFMKRLSSRVGKPEYEKGCFLCVVASELSGQDSSARELTDAYFRRLTMAFENPLRNSRKNGEIRSDVNIKKEAQFITTSMMGLSVLRRAKADTAMIKNSLRTMIVHLEGLRIERPRR